MTILLDNIEINVVINYKNNKNIYFRFKEDGKLYVYCNRFVGESKIKDLIVNNKQAILKMYEKIQENLDAENLFYYLGKPYIIVIGEIDKVYIEDGYIFAKSHKELEKFYLKECERLFAIRVEDAKKVIVDVPNFRLRLRKMKTRWGVCNVRDKIITLNTELLKRDIDLLDYVIIHEMCHFYEANHSARFWQKVEKYYPNYKLARKRLREGLK